MPEWLRQRYLRDMKCTVHDLDVMGSNPCRVKFGCIVLLSKLYLKIYSFIAACFVQPMCFNRVHETDNNIENIAYTYCNFGEWKLLLI